MNIPRANWSYPTAIRFGAGRMSELAEACKATGMKRPLLITDRGLAKLPIAGQALDILESAGLGRAMFSEVDPNPNDVNLAAGLKAFRDGGHDGVVAFGGGSGLDLGKCVAFMAGQSRPVWDFEDIGDWYLASPPSWRCRPRREPGRRWGGLRSSPIPKPMSKRSSSTRNSCPQSPFATRN
jgi:alcohol dehydrogenase class IV